MRLLVSVVSAEEARRALAGGADIIDVKDPSEGALGAPAPCVLSEVVRAVGTAAPVSVALGDLPSLPHTAALAARGAALSGAGYVKVGLRGVHELDTAVAMMSAVADAVGSHTAVIAAAYADARALDPPAFAPAWLPVLVERTGIAGGLVDTFVKDGRGLYGWLPESELADLIARTRDAGASFAVAGQLRRGELRRVAADVVGVRSAVCRGGDRTAELDRELVAAAVAEVRAGATDHPATIRVPTGLAGPGLRTTTDQPGTIRVPTGWAGPDLRTTTATPVRRTASGR
jgi:(5-formylfuran-3-yl)methyl phosphate synthase